MSHVPSEFGSTISGSPVEQSCSIASSLNDKSQSQSKETDLFHSFVDKRKLAKIKPIMVRGQIKTDAEDITNANNGKSAIEKSFSSNIEDLQLQSTDTTTKPEHICFDKDDDSLSSSVSSDSHSMQSFTTNGSLSLLSLATQSMIGGSDAYGQPTESDIDQDDYFVVHNICDFGSSDEEDKLTESNIKFEEPKSELVDYFMNGIVNDNEKERQCTWCSDGIIRNFENFPIHNNWHLDTILEEEEEALSVNTIITIDDLTENFDQDAIISLSRLSNTIYKNDNDDDTVTLATDVVDNLDSSIEINNPIKNQKDSGYEIKLSAVENTEG